jgi:Putative peptidoglycan binding domain
MLRSLLFYANDRLQKAMNNQPPLRSGHEDNSVKCLQVALTALGYELPRSTQKGSIAADGIFGPETKTVVMDFQRDNGLKPDGEVGPRTLACLDNLLLRTGSDPLLQAVKDCQDTGAKLLRSCKSNPDAPGNVEHGDFQNNLTELYKLMFGDPVRIGLKIQALLRDVYRSGA